jgi:RNA polymerase sigma factor (sigma-70 family)
MPDPDYSHLLEVARSSIMQVLRNSARSALLEDIASQAALEYWKRAKSGEPIDNPEGLISVIAHRRAIDALRTWQRRRRDVPILEDSDDVLMQDYEKSVGAVLQSIGMTTSEQVIAAEDAAAIEAAFQSLLSDRDAVIARRCLIEDATPRQVAPDLGLAEQTVKNRLSIIRKTLADAFRSSPVDVEDG